MKVLILTDEQYKELMNGRRKIGPPDPALPDARGMHALAKAGDTPEIFTLMRERMDATETAASTLRDQMHDLILEARRDGVRPVDLMRWSGYSPRRIAQILEGSDA